MRILEWGGIDWLTWESRSAVVSVLDGAEEGDVGQKRRTALVGGRDVEVVGALDLVFQHPLVSKIRVALVDFGKGFLKEIQILSLKDHMLLFRFAGNWKVS